MDNLQGYNYCIQKLVLAISNTSFTIVEKFL